MKNEELVKRINRIVGQLKGIQNMAQQGRDCSDILQQISAIKKAIDGLSKEIVLENITQYVSESDTKKVASMIERAINL